MIHKNGSKGIFVAMWLNRMDYIFSQSELGYGKMETYVKLDKLGEVSNYVQFIFFLLITS